MHSRLIFTLWGVFCSLLSASAQVDAPIVDSAIIGRTIEGTPIKACRATFSQAIFDFIPSIDSTRAYIVFRSIKKDKWHHQASITAWNTRNWTASWQQPFLFSKEETILTEIGPFAKAGNPNNPKYQLTRFSPTDGSRLWSVSCFPVYQDYDRGIIIAHKSSVNDQAFAIDINTGRQLWQTKMPDYTTLEWDKAIAIDSTQLLLIGDNYIKLNTKTGKLTTYEAKTQIYNAKQAAFSILGGMTVSMSTEDVSPLSSPNIISELHSNVLCTDSCFYISDRTHLVRLDYDLNPIWRTDFPPRLASHASLYDRDDKIYMVNYGYGIDDEYAFNVGRPFLASYDCKTGRQLSFMPLTTGKKIIRSSLISDNHAYLMFDDGIAFQSLNDSVANIVPWDYENRGKLLLLLPDTLYTFHDGDKMLTPIAFDGISCPVLTEDGRIYILDQRLNIIDSYNEEKVFYVRKRKGAYVCLQRLNNRNDYRIAHHDGFIVGHLRIPGGCDMFIQDNTVYFTNKYQIMSLDAIELFK